MTLKVNPLVSVIIRSMDRPELADALRSVANQTYPNIEVLVVNASGQPSSFSPPHCRFPLRLLNQGGAALQRAAAANFGLDNCSGVYGLFLDDDDLMDPDHISKLVEALTPYPELPAAYTGVRLLGEQGVVLREANVPWEAARLKGMNFLPIHAVLFRIAALENKYQCRFDCSLDVLEDWDFWLQLQQQGRFLNVQGCSATYRITMGTSGLSAARDIDRFRQAHAKVLSKWNTLSASLSASEALIWFSTAVDHMQGEVVQLTNRIEVQSNQLNEMEQTLQAVRIESDRTIMALHSENNRVSNERDLVIAQREELLHSTSWKVTAPLRAMTRWIYKIAAKL